MTISITTLVLFFSSLYKQLWISPNGPEISGEIMGRTTSGGATWWIV